MGVPLGTVVPAGGQWNHPRSNEAGWHRTAGCTFCAGLPPCGGAGSALAP